MKDAAALDRNIREGITEQANHRRVGDGYDTGFSLTGLGCATIKVGDVSPLHPYGQAVLRKRKGS